MVQYILTFLIIFVVSCQTAKSDDFQLCESWEELTAAGNHPEWKKLMLTNPKNLEKKSLKNGTFKNVPNLEHLWIEGLVNKVEPAVFQQLPKLKKLHLIENVIEELPEGIFDGLDLQVLIINNSQLKNIKPGTLNNIESVILEGNKINPGTIFKNTGISTLDLSNNSISKLEDCAFCGMKNIKQINLFDNSLTSFEPKKILGENSPILVIGLDSNKITYIPKFDSFPDLIGLSVANNSVEKIEDNAFAKCPKFSLLEASGNKLKEIPANIFPEFGDREYPAFLVVHDNQIQCLSQELRDKLKKLRRVTVNGNPWKCECLNDVIGWAKDRKAFVGCETPIRGCKVTCTDNDNKKQVISFPN